MSKVDVQTTRSIEVTLKPGVAKTATEPAIRPITKTILAGSLVSVREGPDLDALRASGAVIKPDGTHKHDLREPGSSETSETPEKTAATTTAFPAPGKKKKVAANPEDLI